MIRTVIIHVIMHAQYDDIHALGLSVNTWRSCFSVPIHSLDIYWRFYDQLKRLTRRNTLA